MLCYESIIVWVGSYKLSTCYVFVVQSGILHIEPNPKTALMSNKIFIMQHSEVSLIKHSWS